MGQRANSGRNVTLDQKKKRNAGRQKSPGRHELNRDDFDRYKPGDKTIGGAFGSSTAPGGQNRSSRRGRAER